MKLKTDFGVRALMGTIVTAGATGSLVYLAVTGNNEAQLTLGNLLIAVVGFYFGARSNK